MAVVTGNELMVVILIRVVVNISELKSSRLSSGLSKFTLYYSSCISGEYKAA